VHHARAPVGLPVLILHNEPYNIINKIGVRH
jgi:hypothetical protein